MKKRNLLHLVALGVIALSAAMSPGAAEADSVIYVAGSSNQFGTLDLTTDVYTNIGTLNLPAGDNMYGMGISGGVLYGVDSQTGTQGSELWQINPLTAAVTPVGFIGQTAIDAGADASGKMYGLTQDLSNSLFYSLNPPSPSPTVIGPSGIASSGLLAIRGSGPTALIYTGASGTSPAGTTVLYSVDPTTGMATPIGDTGF